MLLHSAKSSGALKSLLIPWTHEHNKMKIFVSLVAWCCQSGRLYILLCELCVGVEGTCHQRDKGVSGLEF